MTQVLTIATENRSTHYDLLREPVKALTDNFYENMTSEGNLERQYMLYGPHDDNDETRLQVMEAFKRLERCQRLVAIWQSDKFRNQTIWLEEAAKHEIPFKRSLITSMSLRRTSRSRWSSVLLDDHALMGELVIVSKPYHESSIANTLSFSGVNTLGGKVEIGGGGTVDGRVQELSIRSGPAISLTNAWIGIRPVNDGTADFEPFIPFSSNEPNLVDGVDIIADGNAFNGQAIRVDHSAVDISDRLTVRHYTTNAIAYPLTDGRYYNGRYRAVVRYRIINDIGPSAGKDSTLIALKLYYGPVSLFGNPGIPLETLYLNGTDGLYRLVDAGEVSIPHFGSLAASSVFSVSGYSCGFAFATEFIDGRIDEDHLIVDGIVLIPADRLATLDGFDGGNGTKALWLTTENDETVVVGEFATAAEGQNSLSYPAEGGVVVLAVEENGMSSIGNRISLNMTTRHRYGRYAGNG